MTMIASLIEQPISMGPYLYLNNNDMTGIHQLIPSPCLS